MSITTGRPKPLVRQYDELWLSGVQTQDTLVENLAAGGDITERVFWRAPYPCYVYEAEILPVAASVGVDGSNTVLVTIQNITQGVAIATVTSTTNYVANTPIALTVTTANADIAAGDVIGLIVTQGATADTAGFVVQFTYRVLSSNT